MTSSSFPPRTPGQVARAHGMDPQAPHDAPPAMTMVSRQNGFSPPGEAATPEVPHDLHLAIEILDWDVLLDAVKAKLRRTVGEQLGDLPEMPAHSAALSASLVQAIVLDCVGSLDRLHAALRQERSQRPTP